GGPRRVRRGRGEAPARGEHRPRLPVGRRHTAADDGGDGGGRNDRDRERGAPARDRMPRDLARAHGGVGGGRRNITCHGGGAPRAAWRRDRGHPRSAGGGQLHGGGGHHRRPGAGDG